MVQTCLRDQGEEEKSRDQRDRKKVVREDFLEVAVLELGLKIEMWELSRLKGRVGGKADKFRILWPLGRFMSFPAKTSSGLFLGWEEGRNECPFYFRWGHVTQDGLLSVDWITDLCVIIRKRLHIAQGNRKEM